MAVTSFNHWPQIAVAFHAALSDIVAETTVDFGAAIVAQIDANGQVRSGFMRSSVYTVTKNGSTYGQAMAPPTDDVYLLSEATIENDLEGVAAVAANYAEYQNYGTRYLPPRPFIEPAAALVQGEYEAKLAGLEARLHGF